MVRFSREREVYRSLSASSKVRLEELMKCCSSPPCLQSYFLSFPTFLSFDKVHSPSYVPSSHHQLDSLRQFSPSSSSLSSLRHSTLSLSLLYVTSCGEKCWIRFRRLNAKTLTWNKIVPKQGMRRYIKLESLRMGKGGERVWSQAPTEIVLLPGQTGSGMEELGEWDARCFPFFFFSLYLNFTTFNSFWLPIFTQQSR